MVLQAMTKRATATRIPEEHDQVVVLRDIPWERLRKRRSSALNR